MPLLVRHLLIVAILLGLALPAPGQDFLERKNVRAITHPFWVDDQRGPAAAAAQLVAIGDPIAIAAMRTGGEIKRAWGWDVHALPDRAPPLPGYLLAGFRDSTPFLNMANRPPDEIPREDWLEYHAYCKALGNAWAHTLPDFEKSAHENAHVTWGHLFHNPARYRGEIVPIKGFLKRLRKYDAPWEAQVRGVPCIYEGWVFSETYGSNPSCVVFTDFPEGAALGEKIEYRITSAGYFLKRYRYLTSDKRQPQRNTLFFIAPTFALDANQTSGKGADVSIPLVVIITVACIITGAFFLILFLGWWLGRGDASVRKRLAAARARLEAGASEELGTTEPAAASNNESAAPAETPAVTSPPRRDLPSEEFRENWPR